MKIGIVTYHRTMNYGGCLQALALRIVLEKLGHQVFYVDYWPYYHKSYYSLFDWYSFKRNSCRGKIRQIVDFACNWKYIIQRKKNFEIYHKQYTYPYCKPLSEKYDLVVYGSDQIWRKQSATNNYNPFYFGNNNIVTQKSVAFSASMGSLPQAESDRAIVLNLLKKLDIISVRESDLRYFLESNQIPCISQTLDPTLLLTANIWKGLFDRNKKKSNKPYLLVYALFDVFNENEIGEFARERGLSIKTLKGGATGASTDSVITTAGPGTFLSLIDNAEYVFTTSFHGLAFSLIFQKEVFASLKTNGERMKSLLDCAGIPERFIEPGEELPKTPKRIDYYKVSENLSRSINITYDFLKSITNACK